MTEATPAPAPAGPLSEAEDKQWASFAHLGGILWILPSLIIFLVFKDRGAKTKVEAKEALNWQITVLGVLIIVIILNGILGAISAAISLAAYSAGDFSGGIGSLLISGIGGLLWLAVVAANVIFSIVGFVKVNGGGSYRYPFALRLVK